MDRLRHDLAPTSQTPVAAAAGAQQGTATATLDPETRAMLDRMNASQGKPATEATSPVPNKIDPDERARPRQTTRPGADRGPER